MLGADMRKPLRQLLVVTGMFLPPRWARADPAADAATLDKLYDQRETTALQPAAEQAVANALQAAPLDYGVLWRAARWKWWEADGLTGEPAERLGREAWALGERATKVNPKGIESRYYTALGIGAYSDAVSILKALAEGLESKFNDNLDATLQLDRGFDACGALITKGRYHYELPWPKRSLSKSTALLNEAIQRCPGTLRGYVYLAETLLADGEAKKAKAVLAARPKDDPTDPAEAHRSQVLAKQAEAAIDAKLK